MIFLQFIMVLSSDESTTLKFPRGAHGERSISKVKLSESDYGIYISYSEKGHRHKQEALPPKGKRFTGVGLPVSHDDHACYGVLRGGRNPAIWLILKDQEPNHYEVCYVHALVWLKHRWSFAKPDGDLLPWFTDMGAMFIKGDKVIVWDPDWDDPGAGARGSPKRFLLDKFELQGARLRRYCHAETKHRYEPWIQRWPVPTPVPRKRDPMREFGFAWTWYGKSQRGK